MLLKLQPMIVLLLFVCPDSYLLDKIYFSLPCLTADADRFKTEKISRDVFHYAKVSDKVSQLTFTKGKKDLKNYKGESVHEADINGGKMQPALLVLKNLI